MRWSDDVAAADWIAPCLESFGSGAATSVVPGGFEAYARILHPAGDLRWSEVSGWSGVPMSADAQFHDIALPEHDPGTAAPWERCPDEGTLAPSDAMALAGVLREHTGTPEDCWFCLWDGFGWDNAVVFSNDPRQEPGRLPDPIPAEVRDGPRVRLPGRDYLLYTGPVEDVSAFVETQSQTANLWWPADRSWCVASEIDLCWTYVGGSAGLARRLLGDERIEALPLDPEHSCHRRVRGWQAEAVDAAVAELLSTGETTIGTVRGTVRAKLARRRWRRLVLHTEHECRDGRRGGSNGKVHASSEDDLRDQLTTRLSAELVGLAEC